MRATATVVLLLTLGLVGLLCLATWRGLPQNETKTAHGGEIVFDDFGFAVERTTTADRLGQADQSIEATGRYVCVDLRVTNHAKVVDFSFRDSAAVLVDEQGRTFHVDAVATRFARSADPADDGTALPAGRARVTHLAFDVPDDATGLRLCFRFGSPIMNMLDIAFDGNRTLALD